MDLKILHICVGCGNRLYDQLFSRLSDNKIDQFVFFPRRKEEKEADFSKLNYTGYAPLIHKKWFRYAYPIKIKRYTKSIEHHFNDTKQKFQEYNIIHAHTLFSAGAVAYQLSKKNKIKYIVAIRCSDEEYLQKMPFLKKFGEKIIKNARKVVCISPHLKKKILTYYGKQIPNLEDKIIIIANGIDDIFIESAAQHKLPLKITKLNLLYVGSFIKEKKVPELINFVNKYDYNLTVIGRGGKEQKKVLKLIKKSGNTNYFGRITNKKRLIEFYRGKNIFIMISRLETFGLVYVEAMSQGTPILYSKNTGFDGFFPDGEVGYAVDLKNPVELNEKIQLIIDNYQELSKTCIQKSKEFNWENISDQDIKLYYLILK